MRTSPTELFRCHILAAAVGLGVVSSGIAPTVNSAQPRTPDSLWDAASQSISNLDTDGLRAFLAKHPETVLIDVRMPSELASLGGTIDAGYRSLNINRGWLEFRIEESVPDKNTPIVVFCGINRRSPLAAKALLELGYQNVHNYADGFFEWRDASLPVKLADEAPGTMLFREPVKVADGVYSAIGATAPPTYENSGHNNNLSFVVTDDGVVVVNAGDNYLLAQSLHRAIKKLTDQPVKFVILENGQGHAMLGSSYWREQGVPIIAHVDAVHEMEEFGLEVLERMRFRNRDKAMGTELVMPDITFEARHVIELGGVRIEALNLGPAHSPGDIMVWLPQRKIAITGDLAFHQRLLPVFEHTDTASWIKTWDKFVALDPKVIIPGHGGPTVISEVTRYTVGYLKYMREAIGAIIEDGGMLQDAYGVDQSDYAHLDTYDELSRINAGRIFRAMEFE